MRGFAQETMGADGELERRAAELDSLEASGADLTPFTTVDGSVDGSAGGAAHDSAGGSASLDAPQDGLWAEDQRTLRACASFRASVMEGGWMAEYVRLAELGVLMGDTLFVHGGLVSSQFGAGRLRRID